MRIGIVQCRNCAISLHAVTKLKINKSDWRISALGRRKRGTYVEFPERVEKTLQGEEDGLTWDQLKKKGEIEQARMCYTWARQVEDEIGLTRERRGRTVYWKLKKR